SHPNSIQLIPMINDHFFKKGGILENNMQPVTQNIDSEKERLSLELTKMAVGQGCPKEFLKRPQ
ncbi:Hypothetical predicted protein, partial [Podarcis lilfordi]